jgi:hypothetical protein
MDPVYLQGRRQSHPAEAKGVIWLPVGRSWQLAVVVVHGGIPLVLCVRAFGLLHLGMGLGSALVCRAHPLRLWCT